MYLHLGKGRMLRAKDIIAIYDAQLFYGNSATNQHNCRVLSRWPAGRMAGQLLRQDNKIKSVVLTEDECYYSEIAATTLQGRMQRPWAG